MKKARALGVPCFQYDIDDPEACRKADELVRKYGDWCEDYLIPQVFLEHANGEMRHIFTGYSESIELTRSSLNNLLESDLLNRS